MSKLLSLGFAALLAFTATFPVTSYAQDSEVTANFKQIGRAMRGFSAQEGQELADAMRLSLIHI